MLPPWVAARRYISRRCVPESLTATQPCAFSRRWWPTPYSRRSEPRLTGVAALCRRPPRRQAQGFQGLLHGEDENVRGLDRKTTVGRNSAHSIRINLKKLGGFLQNSQRARAPLALGRTGPPRRARRRACVGLLGQIDVHRPFSFSKAFSNLVSKVNL